MAVQLKRFELFVAEFAAYEKPVPVVSLAVKLLAFANPAGQPRPLADWVNATVPAAVLAVTPYDEPTPH